MDIRVDDLSGPEITALLRLHLAEMHANSPAESVHALDLDALRGPTLTMYSAWDAAVLLGCGAIKELDATHGEVKSIRTDPAHVGRGVGSAILATLLDTARTRGYRRLSLETGTGPVFEAAHRLYARFGFEACDPFADYTDDPFSRYLTLRLT